MAINFDGRTKDLEQMERDKLRSVFPECFNDGELNFDKLLTILGEHRLDDFEKYDFRWKGKSEALLVAQQRSMATLRPSVEDSVNFDTTQNLYIEGDNLEVIRLLQKSYHRQVKMIYIDPPYNTGNDFVYKDDWTDSIGNYKRITEQAAKSNSETSGRYHTDWLNMMYPRLRLGKHLLRDDGVIFVSIDDNEVHNLRKLMDEVFGEDNFVAQFIWQRAFSPKNDARYVSNSHDYVLMYARTIEAFQIGRLPRTEEANARYLNPDNDPRGVWMSSDISVKTYTPENDYPITAPSGRVIEPPAGRCWRLSKKVFFERLQDNRIWFGEDGNNTPRIKRFLHELKHEGLVPQSILFHKDVGHSQEGAQELNKLIDMGGFDGPKPIRLIRHLLTLANSNKDDIIVDFFSGSATTAHAVMQLNAEDNGNRRFIMVQLPEKCAEDSEAFKAGYKTICEIGRERIKRAGAKILAEQTEKQAQLALGEDEEPKPLDVGFRTFKLDTSNVKLWDSAFYGKPTPEQMLMLEERLHDMVDSIRPDRTDLDLVFEVMIKHGIDLCQSVTPMEFDDGISKITAYAIGNPSSDHFFMVCMDKNVTVEHAEEMAEYEPGQIVFSDKSFNDSIVLANVDLALKDKGVDILLI